MNDLLECILPKDKRRINNYLSTLFLESSYAFPKCIDDFKVIGFFAPKISYQNCDLYFSPRGQETVREICKIIYKSKSFSGLFNFNDIFNAVKNEIEYWINLDRNPGYKDYLTNLQKNLRKEIKEFTYISIIKGVLLEEVDSIKVGRNIIELYSDNLICDLEDVDGVIKEILATEYVNQYIIRGTKRGSEEESKTEFYRLSEYSLAVLSLYSIITLEKAIESVRIELVNECERSFGTASCLCWNEEKHLILTRYCSRTQELSIGNDDIHYWREHCYFDLISELLDKSDRNEIEESIIKAILWIAEAQRDRVRAGKFIKLWSSIECYFSFVNEELTERNAKGVASLIVFSGYSIKKDTEYRDTKKQIKRMYKVRSKITHRAEIADIEFDLLQQLSYYAAWVTISMASLVVRNYQSLEQVYEETERLDNLMYMEDNSKE